MWYCELYINDDIDSNRHVATLNHKNNVGLIEGEIIKNRDRYESITWKQL